MEGGVDGRSKANGCAICGEARTQPQRSSARDWHDRKLNGDDGFHVSRSYLRNIELGESMPSRPRMRSLLRYMARLPRNGETVRILLTSSSSVWPKPLIDNQEERRVLLAVASDSDEKTVLLDE